VKTVRFVCLVLGMLLVASRAMAQGSTFHVFPQVADGTLSDGSAYHSMLYIENLSSNGATCTLATSSGLPLSRFQVSAPRYMPASVSNVNITQANGPLATGYATLSCTQPVQASLMYVESAPNGSTTLGMATVFSAPPVTYASMVVFTGTSLQYGLAIANTNPIAISVTS
jgi:hypothetical protein